jgi:hypothetical protein
MDYSPPLNIDKNPAPLQAVHDELSKRYDLANMKWQDLLNLRKQFTNVPVIQNVLAPYEHRAYAREQVGGAPNIYQGAKEALGLGVLTPGYTGAKLANVIGKDIDPRLKFMGSRSDPSLAEIGQSYAGIGEGLMSLMRSK